MGESDQVRCLILGPLQVLDVAGRPLPVRGRVDRVILASLLLEPNRVPCCGTGSSKRSGATTRPTRPANAIQVHISKLAQAVRGRGHVRSQVADPLPGVCLRALAPRTRRPLEFERLADAAAAQRVSRGRGRPAGQGRRSLAGTRARWHGRRPVRPVRCQPPRGPAALRVRVAGRRRLSRSAAMANSPANSKRSSGPTPCASPCGRS